MRGEHQKDDVLFSRKAISVDGEGKSEFQHDLVVWSGGVGAIVAVESELGTISEVEFDFEKLVMTKAPVKLLVCREYKSGQCEEILERLHLVLSSGSKYPLTGEIYLVVVQCMETPRIFRYDEARAFGSTDSVHFTEVTATYESTIAANRRLTAPFQRTAV